jgi:hypothetical protein
VRPQSIRRSRDPRRRKATNLSCRGVLAHHRVYATLGVPIREADSCATARPESSDHVDPTPWSISRPWRANLVASAIERIRCRLRRAGRDGRESLPKTAIYCHLLPLVSRNTAKAVSTLAFVALSRACRSACHWSLLVRHWSLVPGYSFLRVVQIAARSRQDCKALEADLFPGESARCSRISRRARSGCTPSCLCSAPRLTSRAVGCAFSSRFVGSRAPDPGGFDRYNALKIGDLGPSDVRSDQGELALETFPRIAI